MERLSSTKSVLGAKNVGDCCLRGSYRNGQAPVPFSLVSLPGSTLRKRDLGSPYPVGKKKGGREDRNFKEVRRN